MCSSDLLEKALVYPDHLGEGKLAGSTDNPIYYYLGIVCEQLGQVAAAKGYYEKASVGSDEVAGMMYYNDQPADMILYQGLALKALGETRSSCARCYRLIDFGEQHVRDKVSIDYFAVSFPDFMIYEEDFTKKNEAHCYYVMGLGHYGLGNIEKAKNNFKKVLELDPAHVNCQIWDRELKE